MSKLTPQTARISKHLAKNLRAAISECEITQVYLAEECGVTKASVSDWLHGRSLPSLSNLHRIAAVVGKSTSTLLGEGGGKEDRTQATLERLGARLGASRLKMFDEVSDRDLQDVADEILARALLKKFPRSLHRR